MDYYERPSRATAGGSHDALKTFTQNSAKSAEQIRSLLQKGGLQLFSFRWPRSFADFGDSIKSFFSHFWGILVSGALLSLGAPFWFNSLKALTNLRPVVAQKEKKETEQQKA